MIADQIRYAAGGDHADKRRRRQRRGESNRLPICRARDVCAQPGRAVEEAEIVGIYSWALVLEVGKSGLGVPLQTFQELLTGIGNDGTRANTMTTSCTP